MSARPPAGRVAVLGLVLALVGAWHAVFFLVFLVAVLWADEIAVAAARALSAALARQARPVPCAHEHPEDVRDLAGTLVARLCPQCSAQLPLDFEVLKGDR